MLKFFGFCGLLAPPGSAPLAAAARVCCREGRKKKSKAARAAATSAEQRHIVRMRTIKSAINQPTAQQLFSIKKNHYCIHSLGNLLKIKVLKLS